MEHFLPLCMVELDEFAISDKVNVVCPIQADPVFPSPSQTLFNSIIHHSGLYAL